MLEQARRYFGREPGLSFALQDAEGRGPDAPALWSAAPYRLVASSAVVQWLSDLERHLRFVACLLEGSGFYLVSSFTDSNFPELNTLLSSPPFCYRSFPGFPADKLAECAHRAGFRLREFRETEDKEILPSARLVLRRIQSLGASRDPYKGGRLTKTSLAGLLQSYEDKFSEAGGVRLTWKSCVALLQRDTRCRSV